MKNREEHYSVTEAGKRLSINPATLKNWCISHELDVWLSDTAKPPAGKARMFSHDDLRVFATVARMRRQHMHMADILRALYAGELDELPPPPDMPTALAPYPPAMVALRKEVATLQDELDANRALIDRQRGQLELLKQQLADRETELRRLLAELTLAKFHAKMGQDATGSGSEDND